MTLADYIEALAALPQRIGVRIDGILGVENAGRLASWRGDYSELTVTRSDEPLTAAALLADARAADGAVFQGYKGGDYRMTRRSAVWGDPWGSYHGLMLVRIEDDAHEARIRTFLRPDEYS